MKLIFFLLILSECFSPVVFAAQSCQEYLIKQTLDNGSKLRSDNSSLNESRGLRKQIMDDLASKLEKDPNNLEYLIDFLRAYDLADGRGNLELRKKVLEYAARVVKIEGENSVNLKDLYLALYNLKYYNSALTVAKTLRQKDPSNWEFYLFEAQTLYGQKKYYLAVEKLEETLLKFPGKVSLLELKLKAHMQLAEVKYSSEESRLQWEVIEQVISDLVQTVGMKSNYFKLLIRSKLGLRKYNEALDLIDYTNKNYLSELEADVFKAMIYLGLKDYNRAEDYIDLVGKAAPDSRIIKNLRSDLNRGLRRLDKHSYVLDKDSKDQDMFFEGLNE